MVFNSVCMYVSLCMQVYAVSDADWKEALDPLEPELPAAVRPTWALRSELGSSGGQHHSSQLSHLL